MVRQLVVMHAKTAGLQCIDIVQINYQDEVRSIAPG